MATRTGMLGALLVIVALNGVADAASVRTPNFIVEAATPELAQEFATLAEKYRKEKALDWLGQEMPRWPAPCPLKVTVSMSGAKGATSFTFPEGQVYQSMFIEGPLERLKFSVLPHEVTHTVLAHHFRRPVPRWADEGGSVYSEDELERTRHDRMCRDILNAGRGMPLRRLFNLKDYPDDVMVLYAQGYSISKHLIESSDRQTFLNFVGHGMQNGWDDASRKYYKFNGIDEMEQAWLDHLRKGRGAAVARNPNTPSGNGSVNGPASLSIPNNPDARLVVRQSAAPSQPQLDPSPISRGQSPLMSQEPQGRPAAARLGDPIPLTPQTVPATTMNNPRPSAPPVVLFPPEPLPLR